MNTTTRRATKPLFQYHVIEQDGRYLVVRRSEADGPPYTPLIVENCRTKQFAELCCENYNKQIK